MENTDIDVSIRGHFTRNAELVGDLTRRGVDLVQGRSIEHHFWSRSQRDAALLANDLYKRGFLLLVLAPAVTAKDSEYTWNVEAGIKDSIEHAASNEVVKELVSIAMAFNSRYDGWGASI